MQKRSHLYDVVSCDSKYNNLVQVFFGVIAVDGALNRGEMSNVASAYRPGIPPTTFPPSGECVAHYSVSECSIS